MTQNTVAYQLITALQQRGVRYVFGVPSGGFLPYLQAINAIDGIEFVLTAHEGGAAFMAATVGKLTGIPGVCFATFGPGATNLTTGVGSALLDRSPLIALTDDVSDSDKGRVMQMNIDLNGLFTPLTKASWRLSNQALEQQIDEAFTLALDGIQGPVHLSLPVNIANQSVEPRCHTTEVSTHLASKPGTSTDIEHQQPLSVGEYTLASSLRDDVKALLADFAMAKKPLLAIGLRALSDPCTQVVAYLAEQWQIPVVLTPMAKGVIDVTHSSYAGVLFHALSDEVAQVHRQADVVIAVGYDEVEFSFSQWLSAAKLVCIDNVATQIMALEHTEVTQYTQPIAALLEKLIAEMRNSRLSFHWSMLHLAQVRAAMAHRFECCAKQFGPVSALQTLRQVLAADGIMSCDVGAHTHLIGQLWSTNKPLLQLMSNGWSSMGYGIPSAIAAKLSHPHKMVCAVVGDGGFLMTANELSVAKRLNLAIVFVVFSDHELALIRLKQDKQGLHHYGIEQHIGADPKPSHIFGVPLLSTSDKSQFEQALNQAFAMQQPVIVEAIFSSDDYNSLVLQANK